MTIRQGRAKLPLLPLTAEVNEQDHLTIGGCDTVELAAEFGTPLYLFDEFTLRSKCREFKKEFGQHYNGTRVVYAAKAFINKTLALILNEEGLGLDVVSSGELSIARSVGFPLDEVYFHGNNKSDEEIRLALEWCIGRIVVDNFHELAILSKIAEEQSYTPDILLRLSPGVDPHTHQYITTGAIDSKFGFPLIKGEEAITQVMSIPQLNLVGLHFHIGSLIFEIEPYQEAIEHVLNLAVKMKQEHGFKLKELDIGGGFAIQYEMDSPAPPISVYAEIITKKVINKCQELKLPLPQLTIEPGRAIVGQGGVALYKAGGVKNIPGVRCYVPVDGGMGDNIRPALYGAKHSVLLANKMSEEETEKATIAGKFCESGDILARDINLPPVSPGDVIAIADCGAYCLPMASNYNASLKPPVILVKEGNVRLIRRRETFDDLTKCDLV